MNTENILSYWYDIEFFSPFWPTSGDRIKNFNLLPWITNQKKEEKDKNFEYNVYLGKIQSKKIIDKINDVLNIEDESSEKSTSNSCISSFKVDAYGQFVDESFCLSTYAWAMAKIINKKTFDIELSESEINKLAEKQNEIILSKIQNKSESLFLTPSDIKVIYTISLNALGLNEEDVEFYIIINKTYFSEKTSEYNDEDEDKIKIEKNMLSSFFIDDLNYAKINCGSLSFKIIDYINAFKKNTASRMHIDKNIEDMKKVLNEDNYPIGKWPSKYSPSLMQQIAINLAIDKNINQDIFSINGPPGTGKTTLLKEIVASTVVDRALLLSKYDNPDDFFIKQDLIEKTQYLKEYYMPKEDISKYGIIVASSNNAAVENISKELPVAEKVMASECNSALFDIDKNDDIYFSSISNKLFDNEISTWGLISAPLGKRENINKLNKALWFDKEDSLKELYDNNDINPNFYKAKRDFSIKYLEVKQYIREIKNDKQIFSKINESRINIKDQYDSINQIQNEINKLLNELQVDEVDLRILEMNKFNIEKSIAHSEETKKSYQNNIDMLWSSLNIFQKYLPFLFRNNVKLIKIKEIKELINFLIIEISDKLLEIENENKNIFDKESSISALKNKLINIEKKFEKASSVLKEFKKEHETLLSEKEQLKVKYGNTFADEDFWKYIQSNKDSQESRPFTTKKYDTLREELFFHALNLHKAFVLNSKSIRANIHLLANINSKDFSNKNREKAYAHLLNTLFLIVPVVSTTLAAVRRFLDGIGENELGTLIIDEAGQATPQSAIGAMIRCQKAIIVGDPLQIEPVVTIPKSIRNRFSEKYCVDSIYTDDSVSVQSLADYINIYGGERRINDCEKWLGCPLVVHRRCIEPMFSISNKIAYNEKMFNATKLDENAKLSIDKSQWLNVSGKELGNKNHYVQEQGMATYNLVLNSFKLISESAPDLYVISPFTSVTRELKKLLRNNLKKESLKQDNKTIDEWIEKCCGTIHTFQGKEAKEVIIVLGCDCITGSGAAYWVGKNPNIINVAVSRAKLRCVIIGDRDLWKKVPYVNTAMKCLDEHQKKNN